MFSNINSMFLLMIVGLLFILPAYYLQKNLVKLEYKWIGFILPMLSFFFSIIASIPNFKQAFYIQFSVGAFIASVIMFFLYNVITMILLNIYRENKERLLK
ncbi:MAG: hypothetical protein ACI35O_04480 [Bacillaceae bacterium]